jgi:transposase-like protein
MPNTKLHPITGRPLKNGDKPHPEMSGTKMPPDIRRKIILEALDPDTSIRATARKYDIHRNTLFQHVKTALTDAKGKMQEAEFRRRVYELSKR